MSSLDRRLFLAASAAAALSATPSLAQQTTTKAAPEGTSPLKLPGPQERQGTTLQRGGATIFYQVIGKGPPMLLLHGYPLSGALFLRVADRLARNHTVILVDHRGYGLSHAPSEPDTVDVFAEDALAVLDALNLRQAVVGGMSMGGAILFSMLKNAPDRMSGIVLIDTTAEKASPAEAGEWTGVAQWVEAYDIKPLIPFLLPQMLTGRTRKEQPAQAEYLSAVMAQASKAAGIGGAKALATRADATGLLGTIKVPTLVLVGQEDPIYSYEVASQMGKEITGAQLHVVPGAAHAAIFEAPENAGEAIASWASKALSR